MKVSSLEKEVSTLQQSVAHWKKVSEVEAYMRDSLTESLEILNENFNNISVSLDVANSLLDKYKTKPNSNTKPTSATCTRESPELYREDAEFLIKEAGRAERILKERDFYYERYEFARRQLEAYKRDAD